MQSRFAVHVPSADRRRQIIEAAIRVISTEGLAAASTRRIAKEAGTSLAALHYCFDSKDALIRAAWEERADRVLETMKEAVVSGGTLRQAVHEINDRLWALYTADPGGQVAQYELMFHFIRTSPRPAGRWAFDRHLKEMRGLYEKLLDEAGEVPVMGAKTFLRLLTVAIEGALLQFLSYGDAERARADLYLVQDAIVSMAFAGSEVVVGAADQAGSSPP